MQIIEKIDITEDKYKSDNLIQNELDDSIDRKQIIQALQNVIKRESKLKRSRIERMHKKSCAENAVLIENKKRINNINSQNTNFDEKKNR